MSQYGSIDYEAYELLRKEAESLERKLADERKIRLRYQGLVYVVCAELDHALHRHVSRGTGTVADEEGLLTAIRQLRQQRDEWRVACTENAALVAAREGRT